MNGLSEKFAPPMRTTGSNGLPNLLATRILDEEKHYIDWIAMLYRRQVEYHNKLATGQYLFTKGNESAEVNMLLPSPPTGGLSGENNFNVFLQAGVVAVRKKLLEHAKVARKDAAKIQALPVADPPIHKLRGLILLYMNARTRMSPNLSGGCITITKKVL